MYGKLRQFNLMPIGIVLVGACHIMLGTALYSGRVARRAEVLQSDVVVFLIPGVLAFLAYGVIVWTSGRTGEPLREKIWAVASVATFATVVSAICFAMYAFNRYGT